MVKTKSKDGTSIAFDKSGKGPALILVDGAFCFRGHGPSLKLVPLLAPHFTVYSYDRRGRGESTNTLPYTVEKEIEDLATIVEETNEVPFILGTSSGAALVLHALASGIKARKAALFEPPYVTASGVVPPQEAGKEITRLVGLAKKGEAVKYFMTRIMGMPNFIVSLLRLFGNSLWKKNESVAHTLPYDLALMGDYSVPKTVASSIDVTTLLIGGDKSSLTIRKALEDVAESIPQSQIILLKGQSHNASMKVLAPVLIDFFN